MLRIAQVLLVDLPYCTAALYYSSVDSFFCEYVERPFEPERGLSFINCGVHHRKVIAMPSPSPAERCPPLPPLPVPSTASTLTPSRVSLPHSVDHLPPDAAPANPVWRCGRVGKFTLCAAHQLALLFLPVLLLLLPMLLLLLVVLLLAVLDRRH